MKPTRIEIHDTCAVFYFDEPIFDVVTECTTDDQFVMDCYLCPEAIDFITAFGAILAEFGIVLDLSRYTPSEIIRGLERRVTVPVVMP